MNEHYDPQQGSDDGAASPTAWGAAPSDASDTPVTRQHPLTQPVPQVLPPTKPPYPYPYPGAPGAGDAPYFTSGQPVPADTWPPTPGPATWGAVAAPGWGLPGQLPAPGGWGDGAGGGPPPTTWPLSPYGYYPMPPPVPVRTRNHKGQVAVVASLVAVLALLLGAGIGHATWPTTTTSATANTPSNGAGPGSSTFPFGSGGTGGSGSSASGGSTTGAGAPANIAGIASRISPALVDINTNLSYQNEQAAGTGIVLTSNGEVLTNNHVIAGATSISVTDIGNGQIYKANVVGYDRTGDIAVIQLVGANGLPVASIAKGPVLAGQGVVGVGNAGGTGGAPSSAGGSVTALGQSITASDSGGGNSENLTGLIQTNCAIQPGDSGGALVNSSGEVVGMDTAASAGTSASGAASQAYAIPISTALAVARGIEAGRASSTVHIGATGFLGIQVRDSSATGGGTSTGATIGAVVDGTLQGSPGAGVGLVQGDAITSVDSTPVNNSTDLSSALEPHHPGDVIHLKWTDQSGASHTSSVTLAVGPPA
jgi:S1-C subfamily serine protease